MLRKTLLIENKTKLNNKEEQVPPVYKRYLFFFFNIIVYDFISYFKLYLH